MIKNERRAREKHLILYRRSLGRKKGGEQKQAATRRRRRSNQLAWLLDRARASYWEKGICSLPFSVQRKQREMGPGAEPGRARKEAGEREFAAPVAPTRLGNTGETPERRESRGSDGDLLVRWRTESDIRKSGIKPVDQ